ncbi:MAG: EpsI family protein [Burkholderiales bacterium]|nr:MAG: EpsI family protein [Burkholderiales bacterium]
MALQATFIRTPARLPWRRLGGTALALAAAMLAFADTWASMARQWTLSPAYAHGFAIGPISAALAWRMRADIAALPDGADARGAAAFVAACATWLLGRLAGLELVCDLAAVAMLPALVGWRHGPAITRALAFPLGFLVFMVPAGDGLVPTLTAWTADATVAALRLIGVPVVQQGTLLELPTGRWSVVEACSGLHYVIVALMLAVLFGHLYLASLARRAMFVATLLGLALAANWLRAFLTVYAGHLTQMRWGTGDEHLLLGWGLFGAVMLGAFGLARRFADAPAASPAATGTLPAGAEPVDRSADRSAHRSGRRAAPGRRTTAGPVLAAALVMTLAAGTARHLSEGVRDGAPREGFARAAAGALGTFEPVAAAAVPAYGGSRESLRGRFDDGVEFSIAYWADQSGGNEMVSHGNRLVPERAGIVALAETAVHLPASEGRPRLDVRETMLQAAGRPVRSWWWFVADGVPVASPLGAKLATLRGTLSGRGDHAALAWLAVPASDDPARDRAALAARARAVQAFLGGFTGAASSPPEAAR